MFHTFQTSASLASPDASGGDGSKPSRTQGSRRISTSNACVECRRRKIRCDGAQPCGQCQWYQHPEACTYSKPAQRVVPSRKLVDKLSSQIEQYKAILHRLYPQKDLDSLVDKPREVLLDLALSIPAPGSATSPSSSVPQTNTDTNPKSEGEQSLEALEQAPDENPEWDEARKHQDKIQGISDDINGLSMSVDRHSSYVGISSITAALKVIVKVAPIARPFITQSVNETALPSRANSPPAELLDRNPNALPRQQDAQKLIESFFEKVHVFFPMIDERKFWTTYLYGERKDSPWLALLNIVLALGSLASSTSDNETHYVYFTRSRHHLSLESFGSGNLEVLQALAIMSGYYMHYLNRPNEAHSLMGGVLRMATTLGLHREYNEPATSTSIYGPGRPVPSDAISTEMRRRIWWSLFCLDSWASTTTGRPSLGRMGNHITVQPPGRFVEQTHIFQQPTNPQSLEALKILPLVHFSEYCKIETRIQDRLIETPLLKFEELSQFDADICRWHDDLPGILTNLDEPCPEFLRVIRLVMKWRYQNLRIVLHRPTLLSCGLRCTPFALLAAEEKVTVGKCRIIAGKTIEDINAECPPDLLAGWNGVWFAYQACMVPLVSLFTDTSSPEEAERWKSQVEMGLIYFERMQRYSIAAKKSHTAISKLYEAFKTAQAAAAAARAEHEGRQQHMQQAQDYGQQFPDFALGNGMQDASMMAAMGQDINMGIWSDPTSMGNFWDDMMWDTNLPDLPDHEYMMGEMDYQNVAAQALHGQQLWRYDHPQ